MPIRFERGFFRSPDLEQVQSLGIESDRLDSCIEEASKSQYRGVFGHQSFGFNESNLDFLARIPWVEAVWFWDIHLDNVDGIYSLLGLQSFGVHPDRPAIDFSRFPELSSVVLFPRPGDSGLGSLSNIKTLKIWHHKPKSKSLKELEFSESLVEIELNWVNAVRLDGLPALPQLKRLEIHRSRNLEDLGDLACKFPRLEHLVVSTCGRVTREEGERAIAGLDFLTHAFIQGIKLR